MTRNDCLAQDASDPLAPLRDQFALERVDEKGVIYLDGNSLGVLPRPTAARVKEVVETEWGVGLITSWNLAPRLGEPRSEQAGWIHLSERIAAKIARLIGANPNEVVVADSTSLNLYKMLSAAIQASNGPRKTIVSERANFPTDLYIADSLARANGFELLLVEPDQIAPSLRGRPGIVLLTHVNYRTGRMHRMAEVTRAAHEAG